MMDNVSVFQQTSYQARFEWGYEGVKVLAPISDIVVIIDVLSFTTCVDIVLNRGGTVYPYPERDASTADYARQLGAILAGKRGEPISLSPASLSRIQEGARIVLPSPNGSTCSHLAKQSKSTVIAGSLRNASSVAAAIKTIGGTLSVIACGERWPNGSLRPAFEDLVAAGAILQELTDLHLSPEALTAVAAFRAVQGDLKSLLEASSSGQELILRGFAADVAIAAEWNASHIVPILSENGAYVPTGQPGRKEDEWNKLT